MAQSLTFKPHQSYAELAARLASRGMDIGDQTRTERKLAQVGYYRLSGFWYPCRHYSVDDNGQIAISLASKKPIRQKTFIPGTRFTDVFSLYLFDKQLRQLMLDAIERIEIHMRTVVAHEVGYHDPFAHCSNQFIHPRQLTPFTDKRTGKVRTIWQEWKARQDASVQRSREDCIEWYRQQGRHIPIWVAVEAWDFGTLSKYFEILKGRYQNTICKRLGIPNARVLVSWLHALNTLRNRCAHHVRIWNQVATGALPTLADVPYFQKLALNSDALTRLYGLITIIWYLVKRIGPNSKWLLQVANIIDSKPHLPGCPWTALGLPKGQHGFPRKTFGL